MIYHLVQIMQPAYPFLRVMHYVSFRAMAALLTALGIAFICGSPFIRYAQRRFKAAPREHTPDSHKLKAQTPTMGGLFIVGVVVATVLLWANLADPKIWISLTALLLFSFIGFWDDFFKIRYRKGVSSLHKWIAQTAVSCCVVFLWYVVDAPQGTVCLPIFKNYTLDLGPLFSVWAFLIMMSTSNAVNLTDGLDGLAMSVLLPNFVTWSIIAYCAGHALFAYYLHVPFAESAELVIFCVALIGACLGFLWYNAYPAQIFMGDVGSLALGGVLGIIALMCRQELLLLFTGAVFVLETLSVIIQVIGFKCFGVRVFRLAPVHHHFEKLGWHEVKITVRAGIVAIISCLVALMILKIR